MHKLKKEVAEIKYPIYEKWVEIVNIKAIKIMVMGQAKMQILHFMR